MCEKTLRVHEKLKDYDFSVRNVSSDLFLFTKNSNVRAPVMLWVKKVTLKMLKTGVSKSFPLTRQKVNSLKWLRPLKPLCDNLEGNI